MTQFIFTATLAAAIFIPATLVIDEYIEPFTIWLLQRGYIK